MSHLHTDYLPLKLEVPRLLRQQGQCFFRLGLYEEGIVYCTRALALDPMQAYSHNILGSAFAAHGRLAEAEAAYRRSFEINKVPRELISLLLLQKKLTDVDTLLSLETDSEAKDFFYALKYFLEGDGRAKEFGEKVKAIGEPVTLAKMYAFWGDEEEALHWLEKAVQEKKPGLVDFKQSPYFISLRNDERYRALAAKLNFP